MLSNSHLTVNIMRTPDYLNLHLRGVSVLTNLIEGQRSIMNHESEQGFLRESLRELCFGLVSFIPVSLRTDSCFAFHCTINNSKYLGHIKN